MPAVSKKQRRAMAIAEHHPDELHAANKGLEKMTENQLHDFAATKEKGLPDKVSSHQAHKKHEHKKHEAKAPEKKKTRFASQSMKYL